jgi:hypothetical protein
MILHRSDGVPPAADEAAGPAATRLPIRRVTATLLLAASGFHAVCTIPDTATAALGILIAAGILATAGRTSQPAPPENRPL